MNIKLPDNKKMLMFCLDVRALYPSVPRDEARKAIIDALDKRPDMETGKDTVLKLMDFVLDNNIFKFNEKYYVQK